MLAAELLHSRVLSRTVFHEEECIHLPHVISVIRATRIHHLQSRAALAASFALQNVNRLILTVMVERKINNFLRLPIHHLASISKGATFVAVVVEEYKPGGRRAIIRHNAISITSG